MTILPFLNALRAIACALLLAVAPVAAQAGQIGVRLDTGTLSGKGWLDLQFNPGPNTTPAATAVLSGFSGSLDGVPEVTGNVAGSLPGVLVFNNGTPYNDLFQPVTLGGIFSFLLDFSGDFLTAGFDSGSVFAVSLYGVDGMISLGNPDPLTNALVTIGLAPASLAGPGGITVTVNDPVLASASHSPATAVPEPGSLLLVLLGSVALAGAGVRWRSGKSVQRRP